MDFVGRWLADSAYAQELGVVADAIDASAARLHLPYADALSNGDQVMHGGCAASLAALGAQAVTRAALGIDSGPWNTSALQVSYLAAARSQGIAAQARLLRAGKELCFVEIEVSGDDGRAIAHASAVVHGRRGAAPVSLPSSRRDHGGTDPGVMGPHIGRIPFVRGRGIGVEHMAGGTSRLAMPWRESNGDADGCVAEGAVLSLLDTAGAMAAWAETGPGAFRAGTPAMHAQLLAPAPPTDLVAYGRCSHRDGVLFFADVEVATLAAGEVIARGTVFYRIVT
jgi:uncharacterized protein (TIGR00369 family)